MKEAMQNSAFLLSSGKCGNCNTTLRLTEGDIYILKGRVAKLNRDNVVKEIKCPKCKQFITVSA